MIARGTRPIHFEDYSGVNFERLVFAYHLRDGWRDLTWYGQTGSDMGLDIIGISPDDKDGRHTVIQCVNRTTLTLAKCKRDMAAAVAAPTGVPVAFKFVSRASVSAAARDKITAEAKKLGIDRTTIWSGTEFEENLRLRAEPLLRRFESGETFPDAAADLRKFVDDHPTLSDEEALTQMAAVFARPAFDTPFQQESSLPAFQQAIEDTVRALNTGIWRTREGDEIRRIPSIHHIKDAKKRAALLDVVREVDEIRRAFKRGLTDGSIEHCSCGDKDCPVFMVSAAACCELDRVRRRAIESFRRVANG